MSLTKTWTRRTCPKCKQPTYVEDRIHKGHGKARVESCMNGHERYVEVQPEPERGPGGSWDKYQERMRKGTK